MSACFRSLRGCVCVDSATISSYLNEISRITAKRYIPTDGLSLLIVGLFLDTYRDLRGCAQSTAEDLGRC